MELEIARLHSCNDTMEQLILFTKLFALMGLPWMSVCIHVHIHGDHSNDEHCNFFIEVKSMKTH
jgi:hypothetical protein